MMAKNEIKMLLLGAGESGKVGGVPLPRLKKRLAHVLSLVNCAQTNEAYSPWRLQRIGT
jgi:hypothetical protein